jgi:hypothetical protein
MYDLRKLLNDHSARDLAELDNNELQRFETLCENWRTFVETDRQNRDRRPPVATSSLLKVSVIQRP